MYGALLGDYIGSPYEFDMGDKTKDFPLFDILCHFTDDSVMTIAVAEALMDSKGKTDAQVKKALVQSMQDWGHFFPDAGYGGRFFNWLFGKDKKPYNSYGNGSAMRVSSVGWMFDTIEETRKYARLSAEVTHNHPEGIKGAEATAAVIFMARTGSTKEEIKGYIAAEFGYDLSRTCDEIRPGYRHVESCQQTVPEAITAFLEGEDFEDVIRTAVSLGGDTDTLGCIAGSMAEAFYGVPEDMKQKCREELPESMLRVLYRFEDEYGFVENCGGTPMPEEEFMEDLMKEGIFLKGVIGACNENPTKDNMLILLKLLHDSYVWIPCNAVPGEKDQEQLAKMIEEAGDDPASLVGKTFTSKENLRLIPDILSDGDNYFFPVFTSVEEMGEYGEHFSKLQRPFLDAVYLAENHEKDLAGIVVNAYTEPYMLKKEAFELVKGME